MHSTNRQERPGLLRFPEQPDAHQWLGNRFQHLPQYIVHEYGSIFLYHPQPIQNSHSLPLKRRNVSFINCCNTHLTVYQKMGRLTLSEQAMVFTCLLYKSFENTVEKGEIARNEQFLLFPQCFLPV